jgi:DNA-directed RNA polymerase specialized sigma24 family protein
MNPIREKFELAAVPLTSRLKKFFRRRCKNTDEADRVDDWVQETLFRVIKKIESGVEIENIEAYVIGTAHLVFKEFLSGIVVDRYREQPVELSRNILDQMVAPLSQAEVQRKIVCLNQCLLELSAEEGALVAAWFDEPSGAAKIDQHRLMAEQLAVPASTLRVRIYRLMKRLRFCCKNCLERETELKFLH